MSTSMEASTASPPAPAGAETLPAGFTPPPPAIDALKRTVSLSFGGAFQRFVDRAPDLLRSRAASAPTELDGRTAAELAALLEREPQRWREEFIGRIGANLAGYAGSAPVHDAAALDTEEGIAATRLELRAEMLHSARIAELHARLDTVRSTVRFPLRTGALAPAGLCRALQDTATLMHCSGAQLRLLFGAFDTLFFSGLDGLYADLIEALLEIETRAAEAQALLARERERAAALAAAPPEPAAPPPPPSPGVPLEIDPKTAAMLGSLSRKPAPVDGSYSDQALAQELLALQPADGAAVLDTSSEPEKWAPLQRISLAGHFLNDAIADPFVPDELGPQHESVRFPLVKSALTDATLFTAVTHPLRSLVNDLMLKSATSRITGTVEARRMAEVLQQVLAQFDLAPDFVRDAMKTAQPIDESQVRSFFESQRELARQRREAVINEAKRLVVRELELRTFGRLVPPQALRFLNVFWGPLLVKVLLRHGADHPDWRTGLERLEAMLDALEADPREASPAPHWHALVAALGRELQAAGLAPDRLREALSLLTTAWRAPRPRGF